MRGRPRKPLHELSESRRKHLSASEIYIREKELEHLEQVQEIKQKSKRMNKNISSYVKEIRSLSDSQYQLIEPLLIELISCDKLLSVCKDNIEKNGMLDRLNDGLNPIFSAYTTLQKQKISLIKELNNVIKSIEKNQDAAPVNFNFDVSELSKIINE